ncbi:MAG: helix-turn-helix domain-containing protein [Chthonomonadales bacterium]
MAKIMDDAVEIIKRKFGGSPEFGLLVTEEREKADVARAIYSIRTNLGLTQAQLAERIGTTQSVIARLEDSDYDGHTRKMLNRIAIALDCSLHIEFIPRNGLRPAPPSSTRRTRRSKDEQPA